MASTVNVLCPNGKRFNLKVYPNDTIMQVLERVCSKGNFNANEYDLKHQRSVLDVTVPLRYANIPNLAKLEMVKLSKPRGYSSIHIALQVESGERLGHDFKSDASLMDVLAHWDTVKKSYGLADVKTVDGKTLQPVCVYMRREIIGDSWLRHTALKSLGLTGGKAVIRHMHRSVELPPPPAVRPPSAKSSSSQPNISQAGGSTVKEPSPENSEMSRDEQTNKQNDVKEIEIQREATDVGMDTANIEDEPTRTVESDKNDQLEDEGEQPMEVEHSTSEVLNKGEQTHNILKGTDVSTTEQSQQESGGARPKSSSARESLPAQQTSDSVAMETNASEGPRSVESFLQSHGTAGVALDDRTRERIEQLMKKEEEMMRQMAEVAQQLQVQQVAAAIKPAISDTTSSSSQLGDFKFPDAPKKEVRSEAQGSSKSTEDMTQPCERNVLVFNASDALPSAEQFQELPDSFFDVTADDMKNLISDLKRQQASDKPLETKSMRDARMKNQMSKYSKITVRVHFPDHLIVQAFFRPQEKVSALYSFVQECVNDKKGEYHLYTTPPKTILKDKNVTLFEAKLFPAAVIYFGAGSLKGPYLSEDILQKRVTLAQAEVTAFSESSASSSQADSTDHWSSNASGPDAPGPSQTKRRPPSNPSNNSSSSSSKGGQVPKWFKMGKR